MRMTLISLIVSLLSTTAFAQIPKNDDKQFEYYGENAVRRAGAGDLQKRLAHWAEHHFEGATVQVLVDDSTERFIEINVSQPLVEAYFGVKRKHEERNLKYHIKFDTDRKDYKYWINRFEYQAKETDQKDQETQLNGYLSDLKSAASKSLEEEVHSMMLSLIDSFEKAAETELEADE